jgi:hypothetical protein
MRKPIKPLPAHRRQVAERRVELHDFSESSSSTGQVRSPESTNATPVTVR